jgi:hypothetical protein
MSATLAPRGAPRGGQKERYCKYVASRLYKAQTSKSDNADNMP